MVPPPSRGAAGGEGGEGAVRLELVRAKNKFRLLDPTHFRHLQLNVAVHWERPGGGGGARFICELQLHHRFVLAHNEASHAQLHYEFFRAHLRNYEADLSTNLDFMLAAPRARRPNRPNRPSRPPLVPHACPRSPLRYMLSAIMSFFIERYIPTIIASAPCRRTQRLPLHACGSGSACP